MEIYASFFIFSLSDLAVKHPLTPFSLQMSLKTAVTLAVEM